MIKKVTDKQIIKEVSKVIVKSPSIDIMAKKLGVSHSGLYERLQRLVKNGVLRKDKESYFVNNSGKN